MQFLFPGFLWALALIAVPIILHLFYFRRYKKVYFSNVRFLREVKEETSTRNKLRNLLILLMRCLAVVFLVLAFAQPFMPAADSDGRPTDQVSIFIDNSFSMQSFGEELQLLDRAKLRAADVIEAFGEEYDFQVLTHNLGSAQQRYMSREAALGVVESVQITPAVKQLSQITDRQSRLSRSTGSGKTSAYLISDFQSVITDEIVDDTTLQYNFLPIQAVQEQNITIDSVWFEEPVQMLNQTAQLIIRVANNSDEDVEGVRITVAVDNQEKPAGTVLIPARGITYDTARITILRTGWHKAIVRINDFPVQFDDTYYLTFYVKEEVRILAVNAGKANPRLDAVFASNPYFELDNASPDRLNYSQMREYDLIILNQIPSVGSGMASELEAFLQNGGRVLFFPAAGRAPADYSGFLLRCGANPLGEYETVERQVGSINTDDFIFRDVYIEQSRNLRLPVTSGSYRVNTIQSRPGSVILRYRDGGACIEKFESGRGTLLVSSAPLDIEVNTLAASAEIFVPLLYRSALTTGRSAPVAHTVGAAELIEVQNFDRDEDRVFTFKGPSEFIPAITPLGPIALLDPVDQVTEAGFYDLYRGDTLAGVFAFNYDRRESDLTWLSPSELTNRFGASVRVWDNISSNQFSRQVLQNERGVALWRWCIIFVLLFLGSEIALIRLWRT